VARSHGWSLDGIDICELIPGQDSLLMEAQTRIFHPSEVAEVERTKPFLQKAEGSDE
jgi:circadian clock protein KaiC